MRRRLAPAWIAVAMLCSDSRAQTLDGAEFQLPTVVGPAESLQFGAKRHLLQLIRDRNWRAAARFAGGPALGEVADPQLRYLVGVVLWQQGDKVRATQHFRAAERSGLREPYLHKALGVAYYEAHQFVLFEQQMRRSIVADQSDPQPHYYLGRYAESVKGDFADARRRFQQVIALDTGHALGHAYLAYCLERLDRQAAAGKHYQTSIQLLEQNGERFSWPYQGLARLALKADPQGATAWAERAVGIAPDEFETHALLARAHDSNGDFARAIAAASEAVRINPDHARSHYLLFTSFRRLGDKDAALRHLARFQELKQVYGDQ